jgi:hypothetical protein
MRHLFRAALALAASALTLLVFVSPTAFAAADTGANSNPSCIGLFSSAEDIGGGLPNSYYVQLAAHSRANPGHLLLDLIGGPGEHC